MNMWVTLNQDLIEQERWERNNAIRKGYERQRALEIIGYQSTGARIRARAADLLLRLAVTLDKHVAEREPQVTSLRHA